MGNETEINVIGNGTARIFVRDDVTLPFGSSINGGGSPQSLIVAGYDDITVDTGRPDPVNALIYAEGDIELDFQDRVNGAVAAGGTVNLGNSARVAV
ncbi:MAG: hypothetical protein U5K73_09070 [Halofilum sp. (in: g-proteobacteria)]|nr:hypothetical protein [Halofilum sp. (in: g-proteobacteria)]